MPPKKLTAAQVSERLAAPNHPQRLTPAELDRLTEDLSVEELQEVIASLGLAEFSRRLPPLFDKVLNATAHIARTQPPQGDTNPLEDLLHRLDVIEISDSPPSTPPSTPRAGSSCAAPTTPSTLSSSSCATPSTPSRSLRATPSTPSRSSCTEYAVYSPSKVGTTASWFEAAALTQNVPGASVHKIGGKSRNRPRQPPAAAHVVFWGGESGVFESWSDTQQSITGHGLAIHAGFPTVAAANAAFEYARAQGWTSDSSPPSPSPHSMPPPSPLTDNPLTAGRRHPLWYAVCRGLRPGIYRSYLECSLNVSGVRGSLFASFKTVDQAREAMREATDKKWIQVLDRARPL
ncbi:hypothetical protein C8R43DRAFT_941762 [Mycena crocata]|nr:hypothetical protein C8R43DRAFT_941762 [Mycena crocata]